MEGHIDGAEKLPCAKHQGGSNYAPEFSEGDYENELFKSHIQHLIDTSGADIVRLCYDIVDKVDIDCPACSSRVNFAHEGASVFVSCECCEVGAELDYVL